MLSSRFISKLFQFKRQDIFGYLLSRGIQTCCLQLQDFLAETRNHYNAELDSVDFKTSSEAARIKINSWVEEQTQGTFHLSNKDTLVNTLNRLGTSQA